MFQQSHPESRMQKCELLMCKLVVGWPSWPNITADFWRESSATTVSNAWLKWIEKTNCITGLAEFFDGVLKEHYSMMHSLPSNPLAQTWRYCRNAEERKEVLKDRFTEFFLFVQNLFHNLYREAQITIYCKYSMFYSLQIT